VFSLALLAVMVIAIALVWTRRNAHRASRIDIETDWREAKLVLHVHADLSALQTSLLTREVPEPAEMELLAQVLETARALRDRAVEDAGGRQVNADEIAASDQLLSLVTRLQGLIEEGRRAEAADECTRAIAIFDQFLTGTEQEVDSALAELRRHERLLEQTAVGWFLAILALVGVASALLTLWLLKPLRSLRRSAKRVGHRRFEIDALPPAFREVVELEAAMRVMAGELSQFTLELEERVHARTRELESSRAQLGFMLEALPDAVGLLDESGRVLEANRAYRSLFGEGDQPEAREGLDRTAQGYAKWPDGEGGTRLLDLRRVLADRPERLVLEYARDVTEMAEIEAALSATRQLAAIGGLSSAVAHEINNPLAAIAACSEALLARFADGQDDPAEREEYLRLIQNEVYRCKGVTERLLGIFRGASPRVERIALKPLVGEALRPFEVLCAQRDISVTLECSGEDEAETNADAIRHIVANLVMNAAQASPRGGSIRVGIEGDATAVHLWVADEGRGIDPALAAGLFEPLQSGRRPEGGVGIGLFLVRTLVTALGGEVEAGSAEPGRGARFHVTLPARRTTPRNHPEVVPA
jgi:signal transduction histidine kinase/HAMP domain-containing protein